jgi:hypothetical protein
VTVYEEFDDPVLTVVAEPPEGVRSTTYPVIEAPPSLAGAAHERETSAFPGVPVTPVGAPGRAFVGTALLAVLYGPVPIQFTAATRKT